jgi:hypothetical protein
MSKRLYDRSEQYSSSMEIEEIWDVHGDAHEAASGQMPLLRLAIAQLD